MPYSPQELMQNLFDQDKDMVKKMVDLIDKTLKSNYNGGASIKIVYYDTLNARVMGEIERLYKQANWSRLYWESYHDQRDGNTYWVTLYK